MADESQITVEVVYAVPDTQHVVELAVAPGTTAVQAIRLSGLLVRYSEIDLQRTQVGIHGHVVQGDTALSNGDRVEIYRPLIADPKQARRRRAASQP